MRSEAGAPLAKELTKCASSLLAGRKVVDSAVWPPKRGIRRQQREKLRARRPLPGKSWRKRGLRRKQNLCEKRRHGGRRKYAERARISGVWYLSPRAWERGRPGSPVICRDCPESRERLRKAWKSCSRKETRLRLN